METKDGILELLLVSAEGLKNAHHLGSQRHYVTIQFGDQTVTSKITQGRGKKIWWNEKFRFLLSSAEHKKTAKVTLRIMERDKFSEDSSVGETKVHVGDIIREGSKGEFLQMRPAPYNIVLEDGTYRGELKLGLKFLSNMQAKLECQEQQPGGTQSAVPPRQASGAAAAAYRPFLNITLLRIPWRRLFFFCTRSSDGQRKSNL